MFSVKLTLRMYLRSLLRVSSFDTEYRRFFENDRGQINPYYCAETDGTTPDFNFNGLPSNVFVDILKLLPWKEQSACRRVNKLWSRYSDSTVAVTTKHINICPAYFKGWTSAASNRIFPLISGGLQVLSISMYVDLNFIRLVDSFESLRKVVFAWNTVEYEVVMELSSKCPHLKEFIGSIQFESHPIPTGKRFDEVEKLNLNYGNRVGSFTDSHASIMIDVFPNLHQLILDGLRDLSANGASEIARRYADKLKHLEMHFRVTRHSPSTVGIFDGISSCTNLSTLILTECYFTNGGFADALVRGCQNLETLNLMGSNLTNAALMRMAELPKLSKLRIDGDRSLNAGLMPVVMKGNLEQLLMRGTGPSADVIKECVRRCRGLALLDITSEAFNLEEILEILDLYGRDGRSLRFVVRTDNPLWRHEDVAASQLAIKNGEKLHSGSVVIDMRTASWSWRVSPGFVENFDEEYEDPNEMILEEELN